jgi:hypothetical protein
MLPLIDRFSSWVLLILKAPGAIQWGWNLPGRWLRSEIIFQWLPLRRLRRSRLGTSMRLWRFCSLERGLEIQAFRPAASWGNKSCDQGYLRPAPFLRLSLAWASAPCWTCVFLLAYYLLSFLLSAALSFLVL